jgi:histidyl-tRNA synthetase
MAIDVQVAPRLVRGLDYYTRTVFEVHSDQLGAQSAVGGGGRYDNLVREFGGPDTPAIGFSIGMERLISVTAGAASPGPQADACVIAMKPEASAEAMRIARALRGPSGSPGGRRLRVLADVTGRSPTAQMRWASRTGAPWAVFVPRDPEGYSVRNMIEGRDEARQPDEAALRRFLESAAHAGRATP